MIYDGTWDWAPTPSVSVCAQDVATYSQAAAIDIIAHEWGHGVIFAEDLWDRAEGDGAIFHEGWADIVGHFVEWDNQPSGSGDEEADWEFGEDHGTTMRIANHDDDEDTYSLHKQDVVGVTNPHGSGNRLATAYYLMAIGGENPACTRLEALLEEEVLGCDEDVDEIGVNKAGRILFYALTDFATSSSDWDDFGDLAKTAAFFMYANCPTSNAQSEQRAAIDAFQAIGDSPSNFQIQCGP